MVQPLKEIIELFGDDEASLAEALSSFSSVFENEEAEDVSYFLKNLAISNEKTGVSRTYLIVNDDAWERAELQIDGYFTIAIKVLYFNDVDRGAQDEIHRVLGNTSKNCPAYLIGQLARGKHCDKGAGRQYLERALSYISGSSEIVGGRLVYLDCKKALRSYYEQAGFQFLQEKHKSSLIQMYRVI